MTFQEKKDFLFTDLKYETIEDNDEFLLINKSGNIPVHEGGIYKKNSLTYILEKKYGRVFPVYRLDRETSGLILFAKKREFVAKLSSNISDKEYFAIVKGIIDKPLVIDNPIGECKGKIMKWKKCVDKNGKKALTEVYPIKSLDNKTLVKIIPKTGRQHQIRVHLSYMGHPILNDKIYGESEEKFMRYLSGEILPRQLLHMEKIKIYGKEYHSKIPADFNAFFR